MCVPAISLVAEASGLLSSTLAFGAKEMLDRSVRFRNPFSNRLAKRTHARVPTCFRPPGDCVARIICFSVCTYVYTCMWSNVVLARPPTFASLRKKRTVEETEYAYSVIGSGIR